MVWCASLLLGPLLRPDLDILTAHPEDYAQGGWATIMQMGYAGAAVAGIGAAYLARRWPVPAILLALFGFGALAIGILPPTSSEAAGAGIADSLFPYFQFAPLAFFPAIAWISWREHTPALLITTALAWVLFVPLLGHPPNAGIINRAADIAMSGWLLVYARTSRSTNRARPVAAGAQLSRS